MKTQKLGAAFDLRNLLSIVLLLACSHPLFSQAGRGGISGLVADASGAIVPGVSLSAKNGATGDSQTTVTTAAGLYSFISLAPGKYEVTAKAAGFDTVVQQNVNVTVDQVSTVNLTLKVGSVNQVVTVTETTELVDTSNSTVGQLISAETIDRVPLLTRNVYDLVQLSAGVTPPTGPPNSSSSFALHTISPAPPDLHGPSHTAHP